MIAYALGSIKAATSKGGPYACFLVLRPTSHQSSDVLAEAMAAAVEAANEAGAPWWRFASGGPVKGGWATVVARHDMSASGPQEWVDALTTELESRRVAGRLVAVGQHLGHGDDMEAWAEVQSRLYPAMYLSHPPAQPVTDPNAPTGWLGSPEATRVRAEDAIRQCFTPSNALEQMRGGIHTVTSSVTLEPGTGAGVLAAAANVSLAAGVATWSNQFAHRQAVLLQEGEYLLTLADAQRGTLELVERLRASLIDSPRLANYGFIRTTQWSTLAFHHFLRPEMGHVRPQEPGLTSEENPWANSARWQQNYHLHDEYAFDAHALNLLTSQHLERANDLSNWSVTEVDGA